MVGVSKAFQPRRLGSPTTMRRALRSRAYSRMATPGDGPSRVTVSAPSDSASRSTLTLRSRSASESRSMAGVSTDTTVHSASSASAKRLPIRTSCSAWSSGATAITKRSRASHGRETGSRPAYSRAAASTRSAARRKASSRSAIRFGLRKKRSRAVCASSAT